MRLFAINLKYFLVGKVLQHHPKHYIAMTMDFGLTMRLAGKSKINARVCTGSVYMPLSLALYFFQLSLKPVLT